MSARTVDPRSGFFEVRRQPISKVGVFPYFGRQLGAGTDRWPEGDPDKIYQVYRPAEELGDPEAMASFRLVPLLDDHEMVGEDAKGLTPAEQKGVHGVIGEQLEFDGSTLYSNLKVFSQALANRIRNGKKELSAGYHCAYDRNSPGVYQGKKYDVVQRQLRGNHIALVKKGRMGPEVAVLDEFVFAVDAADLEEIDMADETAAADAQPTAGAAPAAAPAPAPGAAPVAAAPAVSPEVIQNVVKAAQAIISAVAPGATTTAADPEAEKEPPPAAAKDAAPATDTVPAADGADNLETDPVTQAALDAANATITQLRADIAARDAADAERAAQPALDEATIYAGIAARDALATRLKSEIGVFDSAAMTTAQVAEYGCEKIGLKPAKGNEVVALDAYLTGRAGANAPAVTAALDADVATDAAPSLVDAYSRAK